MASRFKVPTQVRNSNITSVVNDLKYLHESLSQLEQEQFSPFQEELAPVASRLVHPELLANTDRAVKLLVACCLANILRLYAPDAPFTSEQLAVPDRQQFI